MFLTEKVEGNSWCCHISFGSINIFSQQTSTPQHLLESTIWLGVILVIFALLLVLIIENWKGKINKIRVAIYGVIFLLYTIFLGVFIFRNNDAIAAKQGKVQDYEVTINTSAKSK